MLHHAFIGCTVVVVPHPGQDTAGKQLQIVDPHSGQVYTVDLPGDAAKTIGSQLRMSNDALRAEIDRAAARAQLLDGVDANAVSAVNGHPPQQQ